MDDFYGKSKQIYDTFSVWDRYWIFKIYCKLECDLPFEHVLGDAKTAIFHNRRSTNSFMSWLNDGWGQPKDIWLNNGADSNGAGRAVIQQSSIET